MKQVIFFFAFLYCSYAMETEAMTQDKIDETTLQTTIQEEDITIIQNKTEEWIPRKSFWTGAFSGFTVIAVSEIGDKTFFIAVVLALTYSPICVFAGAISALALMTALSACLGLVSTVIPKFWVQCLAAILFVIFGLKMLRDGYKMGSTAGKEEFEDVQKTLESKLASKGTVVDVESGVRRIAKRWIFLEAFAMTFLAEWGDRSQITTMVLAAKHSVFGVILGATLGHAACTLLAVVGGRLVADKISLRVVTIFGGLLFLVFAICSIVSAVDDYKTRSSS